LWGILIETSLPPRQYAAVYPDCREEFAGQQRSHGNRSPSSGSRFGFLQRWIHAYANRADMAGIIQLSHQLVVLDWENGSMMSVINTLNTSKFA
jgi:hypothetical protein